MHVGELEELHELENGERRGTRASRRPLEVGEPEELEAKGGHDTTEGRLSRRGLGEVG